MAHHVGERAGEHAHLAMEGRHAAEGIALGIVHVLNQVPATLLGLHDVGNRRVRRERLGQDRRTGTGTTAAMRGGEGLVQIDVHGIDAEIARANPADNGVEIGPVAVEIAARLVDQVGNLADIPLEQATRVGIGQHDAGDIITELGLEGLHVDAAGLVGRDLVDGEATLHGGCRIGAVGAFRNEDAATAGLAVGIELGADRHHAAELTMRTGFRRHRHGRHIGQRHQPVSQFTHQLVGALHGRDRLQRVHIGEARKAGHFLVETRIVLHRARTERVETQIDRIVLARQTHIVAHGLRFGEAGQADLGLALEPAKTGGGAFGLRQVNAAAVQTAALEDQWFGLVQTAAAGDGVGITAGRHVVGGDGRGHAGRTSLCVHAHLTELLPELSRRRRCLPAYWFRSRRRSDNSRSAPDRGGWQGHRPAHRPWRDRRPHPPPDATAAG